MKWFGSVYDGRVFGNFRINRFLRDEKLLMLYKEVFFGYDKIFVILIGDLVYFFLFYCMKEYVNFRNNEEVIFNSMLRSFRNLIECVFGRFKVRW